MQTVTLLIEKGGVGKTTLATTTAVLLAQRGHRVLLVDADPQAHATLSVRSKHRDGLFNMLKNLADPKDYLTPIHPQYYGGDESQPNLWLVSGGNATAQLTKGLDARNLKYALSKLANSFDFCVIDTAPSISDLHISFYLGSDYIIYPTECAYTSMQSLFKSLHHLETARQEFEPKGYPVANVLGIVPSKFNGREAVQHQNHGVLMGKYDGLVMSPIKRLAGWEQASQLRIPINMLPVKSPASAEASRFVNEILERLEVYSGA